MSENSLGLMNESAFIHGLAVQMGTPKLINTTLFPPYKPR